MTDGTQAEHPRRQDWKEGAQEGQQDPPGAPGTQKQPQPLSYEEDSTGAEDDLRRLVVTPEQYVVIVARTAVFRGPSILRRM